jgi:hypothetical protein
MVSTMMIFAHTNTGLTIEIDGKGIFIEKPPSLPETTKKTSLLSIFVSKIPYKRMCNRYQAVPMVYLSSPVLTTVTLFLGVPLLVPCASTRFTTSPPSRTLPKTTWRPSNQAVLTVVMKNWDPLVFGP